MSKKTIKDITLTNKKVLIRVDFNVPIKAGIIQDDNRIVSALPTIQYALDNNAKVILFSHLGRVKTEEDKENLSLRPVAKRLGELLNKEVIFVNQTRGKELEDKINDLKNGEILMFENTRFEDLDNKKESKNDPELGKYWASLGDVFVNDAFGTAHRAHASNVGISNNIKDAVSGFLLEKEIKFIGGALESPKRPFIAILGGAKVSDKIEVIKNLLNIADYVLIGGGMAFTFYKAMGYNIGKSLLEEDKIELAKELLELGKDKLIFGDDVITGKAFDNDTEKNIRDAKDLPDDELGLDIGPRSVRLFESYIEKANTIIWNGPVGVFELPKFSDGTRSVAQAIAENSNAISIIGGGDSAAAVIQFGYENKITHISTGGGASLEYLEGKELPGIKAIKEK
jgi:phosphoglycerate kinase